ncbi:hypothetical protein GDO86_010948 [Hymenochirus boettgeri]|uniref:Uncharacterized protein n=1 Tax=Hymenochirus boettgeri TaxID=247094 RepID=A0A8T2JEE7_9PIPI|nr:hypothetical protein GDO86_010948 [Hymenochirus boettgeri]
MQGFICEIGCKICDHFQPPISSAAAPTDRSTFALQTTLLVCSQGIAGRLGSPDGRDVGHRALHFLFNPHKTKGFSVLKLILSVTDGTFLV